MEHAQPNARGLSLPTKILIGLVLGATVGVTLNLLYAPALGAVKPAAYVRVEWWADEIIRPLGNLFLSLLFMVVVPIVFSSLFLGVAGLGSVQKLGSLGSRTLLWFLGTTALATVIGIVLVRVIEPGKRVSAEVAAEIQRQYLGEAQAKVAQGAQAKGWLEMIVDIVPRNVVGAAADNTKVLGLIFFALILGAAAMRLSPERTRLLRELLESLYELCVKVLNWVMELAPYGVACLIFHATAKLGLDVMKLVGWYFLTAMGGLVLYQLVVVTALAKVYAGLSPRRFYAGCRTLLVTAFSTSSSNATMPTTIRTAVDEFGAPKEIAGFVMPLGATMNMNGTAMFEGVSVLFLAQVYGKGLTFPEQVMVVGMAVLTAIGAAGVPGGSLPLLAVVLTQVGVPAELLALILGVDRLVDMTRTVPNVTSDLVCSLWLSRREGHALKT
ncbi:MAG: dicarboxylate/amino acid:cation symporter [Planctomycetes bacterium]|nr:dicarboxylate/amino acid:cation symporter [Planctomycetota bacterium]MCC7397878.1 dicarboxylate/amino acid:cation symporter [Planctomycetota bacterium]